MNRLTDALEPRTRPVQVGLLMLLTTTAVGVVVAVSLLAPSATFVAGAGAGTALFLVTSTAWTLFSTPQAQGRFNPRVRLGLGERRVLVAALACVWVMALFLLSSTNAPEAVAGTLNVWIVIHLIDTVRATPEEVAEQRQRYEEHLEAERLRAGEQVAREEYGA